jgi:hypothetical protein
MGSMTSRTNRFPNVARKTNRKALVGLCPPAQRAYGDVLATSLLILGIENHPRLIQFRAALARAGLPPADFLSWRDVCGIPDVFELFPPERATLLRLESFGEDFETERAFLRLGHPTALESGATVLAPGEIDALQPDHGRILPPRQVHLGFLEALARVDAALQERPAWRALSSPADVRTLFDKSATSALYASLGVPVPRAFPGVSSLDELRETMRAAQVRSVFVKLTSGSSGAGIAVFTPGSRDSVLSTVEIDGPRLYNTRRVQRYVRASEIERVIGFLLREGAHIEECVPKARLRGLPFDCRILIMDGEPAFGVARCSASPIANLHLGARPVPIEEIVEAVSVEACEAALASVRRVY